MRPCLSLFGLIKYQTLAYKQQKFISHSSGGWKSKIRVPAQLSSHEGPLLGYGWLTSRCVLTRQRAGRESKLSCDTYRATNAIHEDSTLLTSSNSSYLPKAPPPYILTLEGKVSYEFGGDTDI